MEFRDAKTMVRAGGNPYNDGTRTKKITFWVVVGHIVFVVVPLVFFWIAGLCSSCSQIQPEKEKEFVVQVGLVSDQPLGNTQEPTPEVKDPPAVEPLTPPPPIEAPPPPIETPKPPKVEPPPQPKPPKVEPKPQPKPPKVEPKPQPKVQPKPPKVEPKPQPKPQPKPPKVEPKPQPKPKPRPYLSVDQIKVTRSSPSQQQKQREAAERRRKQQEREQQIRAQQDYQRQLAAYNAAQQRAAAQRRQALEGIRRNVASVQGVVNAGLQGVQATQYINDLKRVIDPLFIQPSDTLLKGAKPSVNVKLTVSPSGRLVSATIVSRSGNAAMNESVEIWIGKVRNTQLPKPSQARGNIVVTVTLRCN